MGHKETFKGDGHVYYLYLGGSIICGCSVAKLCPTLCSPVDYSPPGSSAHGIFQARILEWVAVSFSWGSFQPRDEPVSPMSAALAGRFFTTEPLRTPKNNHTHAINCYPALPKKWNDQLIQVGWIQHTSSLR